METVTFQSVRYASLADALFLRFSGIDREGKKYERMRTAAFQVKEQLAGQIDLRAGYTFYEAPTLCGGSVLLDGVTLRCSALEQISPSTVHGAYVYAITAGDFSLPDRPVTEQLYADLWGSAMVEAARKLLLEQLRSRSPISDSFGPGYYGMRTTELRQFDRLIDFKQLGISVYKGQILLPQKSCAGLLFAVDEGYRKLRGACAACLGNHTSCQLCEVNRREPAAP